MLKTVLSFLAIAVFLPHLSLSQFLKYNEKFDFKEIALLKEKHEKDPGERIYKNGIIIYKGTELFGLIKIIGIGPNPLYSKDILRKKDLIGVKIHKEDYERVKLGDIVEITGFMKILGWPYKNVYYIDSNKLTVTGYENTNNRLFQTVSEMAKRIVKEEKEQNILYDYTAQY